MSPSVAIVILNYNGLDFLKKFLPSVEKTEYENLTLVVADNGSTDGSADYLRGQGWTMGEGSGRKILLKYPDNQGFAGGYNRALKDLKHFEYYVLLNSDVEVDADWVRPIIQNMEKDNSIGVSQPKILSYAQKDTFEYAGASGGCIDMLGYPFCRGRIFETLELDQGQYDEPAEIFWATGAAMFIRAKLFHALGGFDADYFAHMEEIDLCWRAKRCGYKVMVFPQAKVWHVGGGTLPKVSPQKTFLNFRNSLTSILKNAPKRRVFVMTMSRLVLDFVAGVRFLFRGEFANIWAIVRAHGSFYGQLPKNLNKRKAYKKIILENAILPPQPFKTTGMLKGSIIWQYYAKGKKTHRDLGPF